MLGKDRLLSWLLRVPDPAGGWIDPTSETALAVARNNPAGYLEILRVRQGQERWHRQELMQRLQWSGALVALISMIGTLVALFVT